MRTIKWLQIKVFIGLGLFLVSAVAITGTLWLLVQESHTSHELLSHARQVEVLGQAVQRRGLTYVAHAPRDYDTYGRDVVIFYPDFLRDLDAFDQALGATERIAQTLPMHGLGAPEGKLMQALGQMRRDWTTFRQGFAAKVGDNPNEPRLEWGAEFIRDNQPLLNQLTGELIITVETLIQERLTRINELAQWVLILGSSFVIIGIIWFYTNIIRRVEQTVAGCQRVASGDFGYQLPLRGHDEMTQLAAAFNNLSARARLVLMMLDKMQRADAIAHKLASLWQESRSYLPMEWLGLWRLDATGQNLELQSVQTLKPLPDTRFKHLAQVAQNDASLLYLAQNSQPSKIDDLSSFVTSQPNARLLRELLKQEKLQSALLVPLHAEDGWRGLLVFVTTNPGAYNNEQTQLLANLSTLLANGFARTAS